jgi:hypothetical protein
MSDSDAKSWLSCLGWGCLVLVVVSALGIGGCVTYFYKGGSGAHEVARSYLAAVDAGRFDEAFETLGPGFTEERGVAEFIAFEETARAEFGACGDWRLRGTTFDREPGLTASNLTFLGSCEDQPVTVTFILEKLDDRWVIQDIRYNGGEEPIEPAVERCSDCGAELPPDARFCPSCGARIGAATGEIEEGEE